MKEFFVLIAFVCLLSPVYGAGSKEHNDLENTSIRPEGPSLKIVAATSIIGDVVKNIIGNHAELTILMPRGQNIHSYIPSPRDIVSMEKADIIFVNGQGLEEGILSILENMENKRIVEVSRGIEPLDGDDHSDDDHSDNDDHHHSDGDPHFWFSPLNVIQWTSNIAEDLAKADPENGPSHAAAAQAYTAQLMDLHMEVQRLVAKIPPENLNLLMDHSAIQYYARDYGFTILGNVIPSVSDQAESSARQIIELVKIVDSHNVKAIFVGKTASQSTFKLAETVAAESKNNLSVVSILTASLALEGQRGDTYIDFVRYNTEKIVEALL